MRRSTKISLIVLFAISVIVCILTYVFRDNANKKDNLNKSPNISVNKIRNIEFDNAKFDMSDYNIIYYNKNINNMTYMITIYHSSIQVINLTKDSLEIELLKKQLK